MYLQCPMAKNKKKNDRNDNDTSVTLLHLKPCSLASKLFVLACKVLLSVIQI